MGGWVGPAIIAAVISSLVSAAGWYVSYWTTIQTDHRRRREKVRDFQIALRAEIRSELHDLRTDDVDQQFALIEGRY